MKNELPPWAHVAAGSQARFLHTVTSRADGGLVQLPVIVIRGAQPGKTLLVTAGVHGDEFEGMAAIERVAALIVLGELRGTLVLVPVANPPAYEAGLRVNPDDRQDMARVFPGDPGGTVTEQIAHCLTSRFIRGADFYLDLHSAGQYYRMPHLVGYQLRAEPLLSAQRAAARDFGLPLVWGTTAYPGRSLSAAGENGVPALYAEITGEGRCLAEDVAAYTAGVARLLSHLEMMNPVTPAPPPRWVVEDDSPQAGFLQVQNRAPTGGFFAAEVLVLDKVSKGQRVGAIRDTLGNELREVTAPHDGLVVFLRTFPRVHAGDPVCTILKLG